MSLGSIIGKGFLKVAKMGDEIDEGLNDLFGENRSKAGEGFSNKKTGKKAALVTKKTKSKNLLTGKKKDDGNVGSNILGKSEDQEDEEKRRFF